LLKKKKRLTHYKGKEEEEWSWNMSHKDLLIAANV